MGRDRSAAFDADPMESDAEPSRAGSPRVRTARPASAARATYHHGDLRRALLEAGTDLAREGGPDKVVLREATRRVGVSANAAYRHFADRDALLGEVVSRAQAPRRRRHQRHDGRRPRTTSTPGRGPGPGSGPSASATCASPWTSRASSAQRSPCPSTSAGPPRPMRPATVGAPPSSCSSDSLDAMVDAGVMSEDERPGSRAARLVGRPRHGDARARGAAARPPARRRRRARAPAGPHGRPRARALRRARRWRFPGRCTVCLGWSRDQRHP